VYTVNSILCECFDVIVLDNLQSSTSRIFSLAEEDKKWNSRNCNHFHYF